MPTLFSYVPRLPLVFQQLQQYFSTVRFFFLDIKGGSRHLPPPRHHPEMWGTEFKDGGGNRSTESVSGQRLGATKNIEIASWFPGICLLLQEVCKILCTHRKTRERTSGKTVPERDSQGCKGWQPVGCHMPRGLWETQVQPDYIPSLGLLQLQQTIHPGNRCKPPGLNWLLYCPRSRTMERGTWLHMLAGGWGGEIEKRRITAHSSWNCWP